MRNPVDKRGRNFAPFLMGLRLALATAGAVLLLLSCEGRSAKVQTAAQPPQVPSSTADPQLVVAPPPSPFMGVHFGSLDDLGRAFLQALHDSSEANLESLRVSRAEYEKVVWNALPPEEKSNIELETAWSWVDRDSRVAVDRALHDHGRERLTLVRTHVSKETRIFPNMKLHYGLKVVARDDRTGEQVELDYMNVVEEIWGRFRVVAYDS